MLFFDDHDFGAAHSGWVVVRAKNHNKIRLPKRVSRGVVLMASTMLQYKCFVFFKLNSHISCCKKSSPSSQGRKTPFGSKERTMYSPYKEKAKMVQKHTRKKRHILKKTHVCLSGRLHIEGRLNEGPRLQRKHKDENEANKNKRNIRERHHDICKPNARRAQVRATCSSSTRASEPARARLLWVILSLVLPVTFGHTHCMP